MDSAEPQKFPRFELSTDENVCLIAAHVASGRWMQISMDEPQAMTWFLHFLQSVRGQPSEAVPAVYAMMRSVLMAHHKTDCSDHSSATLIMSLPKFSPVKSFRRVSGKVCSPSTMCSRDFSFPEAIQPAMSRTASR